VIREAVDLADAGGEGLQHALAPAARDVRKVLLIQGFVGLGEEGHGGIFGAEEFFDGNGELDFAAVVFFHHRKIVQAGELLGWVGLRVAPVFQVHGVYFRMLGESPRAYAWGCRWGGDDGRCGECARAGQGAR
jgi:hypothetical protein